MRIKPKTGESKAPSPRLTSAGQPGVVLLAKDEDCRRIFSYEYFFLPFDFVKETKWKAKKKEKKTKDYYWCGWNLPAMDEIMAWQQRQLASQLLAASERKRRGRVAMKIERLERSSIYFCLGKLWEETKFVTIIDGGWKDQKGILERRNYWAWDKG